jgi:hypothetical protein
LTGSLGLINPAENLGKTQLRIIIETYKRQDGEALLAKKVGEGGGESDIPEPPKTHQKNAFFLS